MAFPRLIYVLPLWIRFPRCSGQGSEARRRTSGVTFLAPEQAGFVPGPHSQACSPSESPALTSSLTSPPAGRKHRLSVLVQTHRNRQKHPSPWTPSLPSPGGAEGQRDTAGIPAHQEKGVSGRSPNLSLHSFCHPLWPRSPLPNQPPKDLMVYT